MIDKVGMFPEKFFIYYEEWDWSSRIKKAGYKIYYQATALIYHKESITMGKQSAIKVYYHTRNRILYMRRNSNAWQFLCFSLFFAFLTFPKTVLRFITSGAQFPVWVVRTVQQGPESVPDDNFTLLIRGDVDTP